RFLRLPLGFPSGFERAGTVEKIREEVGHAAFLGPGEPAAAPPGTRDGHGRGPGWLARPAARLACILRPPGGGVLREVLRRRPGCTWVRPRQRPVPRAKTLRNRPVSTSLEVRFSACSSRSTTSRGSDHTLRHPHPVPTPWHRV